MTAIDEPGARSILKKNEINLVLGDVRLPEGDGISLLEWMMRSKMEVPFIVMTDYACITDAVRAIKLGAKDYLQKPVHQELLIELVHSMLKQPVIVRKERSFVERTSEAARKAASLARRVASSELSVLILGPSGSGKEVIAQMIHRYSDRRDKPFVAVNCGSIPNDLQASEFLVRSRVPLPEQLLIGRDILKRPMEEPYFWMKSVICRIPCRFFSFGFFRKRSLILLEVIKSSILTCVSYLPPMRIWKRLCRKVVFVRICIIALQNSKLFNRH